MVNKEMFVQGQTLLDETIVWRKSADPEYPFASEVHGDTCRVRINDFPADNLYTLIVNGNEIASFDDWPSQWTRPKATSDLVDEVLAVDEILALAERTYPEIAQIILLLHVEGYSWDEIAVQLGVKKETLRTRYNRGLIKLRKELRHTGS